MDSGPYGEGPDDDRKQIQLGPCIGNALRICYGEDMETETNANLNKLNSDVTPKGTINSVQESDAVSNSKPMKTITNLETTRGKNSASENLTGDKPSQETNNNNECRSSVRCGHCSCNHNYKECDNREEEPKCALCDHQQRTRDKEPENTEVNQPKKRRLHNTSVETPTTDNSIKNSNNNNKIENDARKASPNINKIPFKKNENANTKMTKEDNRDKTKEKETTNIQKRGLQPNPSTSEQISLNHIIKD
ncbi:GATA zinc finger domain-containing protein 4-like [Ctenocephalides felis]|uniref:GATA zinc finger domain-containing protein 4-like n=1 Tax=Ctenocephalides felis TaxID=7515 RepID=UPI000E6E56B5|nr:GATA zinc finger domain-containing protein 4-like [Ctenocephalides felis]